MYRAELSGSCKWLDCIEQVQLRTYRYFWGLAGYIPRHLYTNCSIRLKWEAKKRCIDFWHKVRTLREERLVKKIAIKALSLNETVKLRENLSLDGVM